MICYISPLLPCSGQNLMSSPSQRLAGTDKQYDSVKLFRDSIVYVFNSNYVAKADNQLTFPLHFRVSLPPKMRSKYAFGMDSFGFLYDKKQVVYIYVDYQDHQTVDTAYRVTDEDQLEDLLLDKMNMINDEDNLDIDKNPYNKERESWILKKGKATILLYNIRKDQYPRFLDFAHSFAFLQQP